MTYMLRRKVAGETTETGPYDSPDDAMAEAPEVPYWEPHDFRDGHPAYWLAGVRHGVAEMAIVRLPRG